MSLVKALSLASGMRKLRVAKGIDKKPKKPKKKGLSSNAFKRQLAIRMGYAQKNVLQGIRAGQKKDSFAKSAKKGLQNYGAMVGNLYKKTPKTQLAIGAAGTATSFTAGGYFLNRKDDE